MKALILLLLFTFCLDQCKSQPKIQSQGQAESKTKNKMIFLTGGKYISSNNLDTAEVFINPFLIDRHEVTVGEFALFVQATGYITDAEKPGASSLIVEGSGFTDKEKVFWKDDELGNIRNKDWYDYPVVHISYNDAKAYAAWINKRLPTIYEWEYAATTGKLKQEEKLPIDKYEWFDDNSGSRIQKVGGKIANANGLYDMLGNVSEIVELPKASLSRLASRWTNGVNVCGIKGGTFRYDKSLINPRITSLGRSVPSCLFGFRCAKDTLVVK